jgi:hypothetical protein
MAMLRTRWPIPLLAVGVPLVAWGQDGPPAVKEEALTTPGEDATTDFNKELYTVEEKVDALKERVFRSKATLQLLKEIVIEGSSSGSRATIWHVNKLGTAYRLEAITYLLDGQTKFQKADPAGSLSDSKEFKIHDGALPPGNHNLSVDARIRPTGFGVFSYARNYEIGLRSNWSFVAELGRACTIRAILSDKGGVANSFEERAKVDFELKCERIADAQPKPQ